MKLCSNESPFGPSPKAVKAVKREADKVGEYPESSSRELKEAIGEHRGINPSRICIGNGSDEIMDLLCKAVMDPGDKALIPMPTFSQYELACRVNSVEPKFVELEDFKWDPDFLVDEMNDVEAAFIGRPNNPTGNSISDEGLKKLLETGKAIIVDEAYGQFSDYSVMDWIDDYDNLIVLRTFSKIYGLAGLRIGYGIASEEVILALRRVQPPFSVNRLAQKAALAALDDRKFVEGVRKKILEERERLREELEGLGFEVLPSDANFLMVSPRPLGSTAPDLYKHLSEKGILIRNLSGFRGIENKWARITVGTAQQNNSLIEALKKYEGEECH